MPRRPACWITCGRSTSALTEAAPRTASGKVNEKLALEILRQAILRNPAVRDVDVTASMAEAMPIGELAG